MTHINQGLAEYLLRLKPRRTYSREEVESLMAALSGLVSDGVPLLDYGIEEAPQWFEVLVNFEDWNIEGGVSSEVWYFFKTTGEENQSGQEPLRTAATPTGNKVLSSRQEPDAPTISIGKEPTTENGNLYSLPLVFSTKSAKRAMMSI